MVQRTSFEVAHTFELLYEPADANGEAPEEPVLEVRSVNDVHGLEYVEAVRFGDS